MREPLDPARSRVGILETIRRRYYLKSIDFVIILLYERLTVIMRHVGAYRCVHRVLRENQGNDRFLHDARGID